MPTERDAANPASPPKLDMLRLEDRLNPVGALTADALLSFAPNPVLDLGAAPSDPVGVSTPAVSTAPVAPADPVLAPNQYELVLPTTTDGSPSTDSSGGAFALFSVVPPPPGATLSGFVYVDEGENGGTRDDGIKQAGEPGIPGTTVSLLRVINGVSISAGQTVTDENGFYQFPSLSPFGVYQVVESNQPTGFLDGKDTAGTVNGTTRGVASNERVDGITLAALDAGVNYNFGELRVVQQTGALSGYVYEDEGANGGTRDDGVRQAGETPIAGATVTLFRVVNGQTVSVSQTTTDTAGFYRFANLTAAGGYIVRETQPANYSDGKDTPGTTGGTNSANDELSAISVPANGESFNNNFGELVQRGALSGYVYVDEGANGGTRDDGVKQAGEPGIPGTTVTLFRVVNGQTTSVSQTTTDANGFYRFANLVAGAGYIVRETQPSAFDDGKDTAGSTGGSSAVNDDLSAVTVPVNGESFNNNFGELVRPAERAQLSGFVYVDSDDDGVKDAGEAAIPGTTVTLFRVVDGNTTSLSQTTTNGDGFYSFTQLEPGTYEVRETQPANFNDGKDTAGSTGGTAPQNDRLVTIPLTAGANSQNNNFGELVQRGALSGYVYVDEGANGGTRDDGVRQAGETPISGVTVTLFRVVDGQTVSVSQTTTDAAGFYRFANLTPGTGYMVRETQPTAFNDGKDTAGTTGGSNAVNDELSAISVPANGESFNNNFGELIPTVPPAQLSGFVYEDPDNDGAKDAGEAAIPGTTVTLFRVVDGNTTSVGQTTTNGDGFYQFTALTPGTYEVRETQPASFLDGKDTAGTRGGVATNDKISTIVLNSNDNSQNNNFGELRPARLSGFEYVDEGANGGTRDDGIKQPGEPGIPGTTVVLSGTDDLGGVTRTATTAADGSYAFGNLRPGTYTVNATQPAAFNDGKDTAGSKGGTATNDQIAGIPIVAGDDSVNNNFGELVQQGTLSGFVYVDPNDNGAKENGEAPIQSVTVTLFRVVNGQTTSLSQTTTDPSGFYQFANLTPGAGYIVRETQPANFTDGKDTPGSTGGTNSANDELSAITVPVNGASINNNFGELVPPPVPAQLSGFVYVDTNDNGVKDPGEAGIPGVVVRVGGTASDGQPTGIRETTTDANGFYSFPNLPAGTYGVQEVQPAAFRDGKDTPGSTGGGAPQNDTLTTVVLPAGANSVNNNFGELVPPAPAQLSGFVYQDANDNGVRELGEVHIAGATVTLFRVVNGQTTSVGQTTTDGTGAYTFGNLEAGTYEVRETQPAGFTDGKDTPGSKGGDARTNDRIASIPLVAGDNSVNNNFGELVPPPVPAQLSGFVYVDTNDNGVKDPGEAGIPGVVVRVGGTASDGQPTGIRETTTDANGFYSFPNLPAGTYGVQEVQPAAFRDGKDTPGSTGGGAPQNDTLTTVVLPAGANSVNNNFGELSPPPAVQPGSVNGFVYEDANDNGVKDAGEAAIPGTTVRLTNGTTTLTTTTDGNGFYQFTGLTPGQYSLVQSQPADFLDGQDTPGSTGGSNATNDVLSAVTVPAGGVSTNNNFGELKKVSLYGYVWYDANENGRFDPVEMGLGGATVTLTGTTTGGRAISTALTGGAPLTVTTDSFGRYSFPSLPTGTYSVVQTNTPTGYNDFLQENAARLTVSSSSPTQFVGTQLNRDAGPLNFGKVNPSIIVSPPVPNPQLPDPNNPSKQNFLGSTTTGVTSPPTTPGRQLPVNEAGPFNPSVVGPTGTGAGQRIYAVGAGAGSAPVVRVFDAATGGELYRLNAYDPAFLGGVTTAVGDINNDGFDDVIVAAGAGGGPHVKVFNGQTGALLQSYFAFDSRFTGGVWLASGDVNDDGWDDVVVGAGAGGGSHVKSFSGRNGELMHSFFAFDLSNTAGARVAVGDFNGDGYDDIAAATGAGVASQVATFDGRNLNVLSRISPYAPAFLGGVNLSAGDVNGDGRAEIITGAGQGGGPHVRVLNATTGAAVFDFFATSTSFTGGVTVASRDLNADGLADIVTGTGPGAQARIQVFSGANLATLDNFFAFESANTSGVFVG